MEIEGVYILSAVLAGIVSFFAPCTLPLIPAYLGFISGVSQTDLEEQVTRSSARRAVVLNGVLFVLGFSSIFIALGFLAGHAGGLIGPLRDTLLTIGGFVVILFGLFLLNIVHISSLSRSRRLRLPSFLTVGRPESSFLLGGIFALGWTPCIGPVLATILFLASSTETALAGALLLAAFAFGLGVPFLLVALLISRADAFVLRATPYLRPISYVGGVSLVLLGLALVSGELGFVTSWIYGLFEHIPYEAFLLRYL